MRQTKEHDVLTTLKKSLGVAVVETHQFEVLEDEDKKDSQKMDVVIRGLKYYEELRATNLAYTYLRPVNLTIAEPLVKAMFVSFAIVSINGIPKPVMMGLDMDELSEESWKTSQSYSEELNEQASILLAAQFMDSQIQSPLDKIVTEYEKHFIKINVEKILAHLVQKAKDAGENKEEPIDGKK